MEPAATAREKNERRSTRTVVMSSSVSGVGDPGRGALVLPFSALGMGILLGK